jgi:hypothetical protein
MARQLCGRMILQMDRCEIAFGQIGYEMLLEQNADVP